MAQHTHPAKDREQFHNSLKRPFDNLKATALPITGITVNAGADYQLALIRLTDIGMHRVGHHNRMQNRLERFGYQCLQGVTLDRQAQPRHCRQHTGMTGYDHGNFFRTDVTAACFYSDDRTVFTADCSHFAILNNVHAMRVRGASKPPGNRIMPGNPAPRLIRCAENRITHIRRSVHNRDFRFYLRGIQ